MSEFKLVMPKMGESVQEATITKWFVKEGDSVEEEQALLEIATDKVDSEIPSPVDGKIKKIFRQENDLVPVGEVIALIAMDDDDDDNDDDSQAAETQQPQSDPKEPEQQLAQQQETGSDEMNQKSKRFYSPLVRNIAKKENISFDELESIKGSGRDGRVTKADILGFLEQRKQPKQTQPSRQAPAQQPKAPQAPEVKANPGDEVVEMGRMRKIIAEHMVMSKQVSPHVTSVIEADVTNIVLWRNQMKQAFLEREKEKLTFMPFFIEATARALKDFPQVNASVSGEKMILRKRINIGIAVALPDNNLIVPVIHDADEKNLTGLTKNLNRLAQTARDGKLSPDDIQGGTFSITNFGTFDNLMGTPIINQPQVAILATGAIKKVPAVIETPTGDIVGIRHKMFLSLTYDHRIVDGALGGAFLKRIAEYLENFDTQRKL